MASLHLGARMAFRTLQETVMSIFRFKSRETGDLVMLQQHGKHMLEIMGKDPSAPGIILPEQMPAAAEALRQAAVQEERDQQRQIEEAKAKGDPEPVFDVVSLRTRTLPFIEMMQRCQQAGVEIVWGV
jgi:hypothetical protein